MGYKLTLNRIVFDEERLPSSLATVIFSVKDEDGVEVFQPEIPIVLVGRNIGDTIAQAASLLAADLEDMKHAALRIVEAYS